MNDETDYRVWKRRYEEEAKARFNLLLEVEELRRRVSELERSRLPGSTNSSSSSSAAATSSAATAPGSTSAVSGQRDELSRLQSDSFDLLNPFASSPVPPASGSESPSPERFANGDNKDKVKDKEEALREAGFSSAVAAISRASSIDSLSSIASGSELSVNRIIKRAVENQIREAQLSSESASPRLGRGRAQTHGNDNWSQQDADIVGHSGSRSRVLPRIRSASSIALPRQSLATISSSNPSSPSGDKAVPSSSRLIEHFFVFGIPKGGDGARSAAKSILSNAARSGAIFLSSGEGKADAGDPSSRPLGRQSSHRSVCAATPETLYEYPRHSMNEDSNSKRRMSIISEQCKALPTEHLLHAQNFCFPLGVPGGWYEQGAPEGSPQCHTFVLTLGEGEPLFGVCLIDDEPLGDVRDVLETEAQSLHEQLLIFEKAQKAAEEANRALSKKAHNRGFSYTFAYGGGSTPLQSRALGPPSKTNLPTGKTPNESPFGFDFAKSAGEASAALTKSATKLFWGRGSEHPVGSDLFNQDVMKAATSVETLINSFQRTELAAFCSANGLSTAGSKITLARSIVSLVAEQGDSDMVKDEKEIDVEKGTVVESDDTKDGSEKNSSSSERNDEKTKEEEKEEEQGKSKTTVGEAILPPGPSTSTKSRVSCPVDSRSLRAARAYCFLSKFPLFSLHFEVLRAIVKQRRAIELESDRQKDARQTTMLDITANTLMAYATARIPLEGGRAMRFRIPMRNLRVETDLVKYVPLGSGLGGASCVTDADANESVVHFAIPREKSSSLNPMPLETAWAIAVLFRKVPINHILSTFRCLLLEQQVAIIHRKDAAIMSACCSAWVPLLRPFRWVSTFIPVLPRTMLDFLYAPVPFLVGVPMGMPRARMIRSEDGQEEESQETTESSFYGYFDFGTDDSAAAEESGTAEHSRGDESPSPSDTSSAASHDGDAFESINFLDLQHERFSFSRHFDAGSVPSLPAEKELALRLEPLKERLLQLNKSRKASSLIFELSTEETTVVRRILKVFRVYLECLCGDTDLVPKAMRMRFYSKRGSVLGETLSALAAEAMTLGEDGEDAFGEQASAQTNSSRDRVHQSRMSFDATSFLKSFAKGKLLHDEVKEGNSASSSSSSPFTSVANGTGSDHLAFMSVFVNTQIFRAFTEELLAEEAL